MGKGDKKSKRGKRWKGSFGVSRSKSAIRNRLKRVSTKKASVSAASAQTTETPVKARRTTKKKTEA